MVTRLQEMVKNYNHEAFNRERLNVYKHFLVILKLNYSNFSVEFLYSEIFDIITAVALRVDTCL